MTAEKDVQVARNGGGGNLGNARKKTFFLKGGVPLGVSRTIYVNVDSPNQGFPYLNFLGEAQCKKHPVYLCYFSPWLC